MKYRNNLPQMKERLFITDGGLETTLVYQQGVELPEFAAIDQFRTGEGCLRIELYYRQYLDLARAQGLPFVLESPTWRASHGWCDHLGYTTDELDALNRRAIELMIHLREEYETMANPIVISGCIGPEGDGYSPERVMTAEDAEIYHQNQINVLAEAGVDLVTGVTMTYAQEAMGVVRAAKKAGVPVAISFTVETDGRLVTGQSLADAIREVDLATGGGPAYYMINSAHPSHFESVLKGDGIWKTRIRGIRANASKCSHEELDNSSELDEGNPLELGRDYQRLMRLLPNVTVIGGCCGTDIRHVSEMVRACIPSDRPAAAQA